MSSIVEQKSRAGRKPGPMTAEAKAAMIAKRVATIASKQATAPKERKKRAPLSDEAKKSMAAKRAATLAAKAVEKRADEENENNLLSNLEEAAAEQPNEDKPNEDKPKEDKPNEDKPKRKQRAPLSDEAKKLMAAKRAATLAAKAAKAEDNNSLQQLETLVEAQADSVAEPAQGAIAAAEQPLPPSPTNEEEDEEKPSTPTVKFAEPLEAPPAPKKQRGPQTAEAKALASAKRAATIAAKKIAAA